MERAGHQPTTPWRMWLLPMMTIGLMLGILAGRTADSWWIAFFACLPAMAAVIVSRRWVRSIALAMCAACFGALLGFGAYHPALPDEGACLVEGTVVQTLSIREDAQVQTVLHDVKLDGNPLSGDAYWTWYLRRNEPLDERLIPGQRVSFSARVYHPGGQTGPGGFDFREYLLQQGIRVGIYGANDLALVDGGLSLMGSVACLRHDLQGRLISLMGKENGAYAATMLLGSRKLIDDADRDAFNRLGIAHILSVSGYHVGILAAMMAFLLRPTHLRAWLRMLLEGIVLLGYALLAGGNAPIVRATLMFLIREAVRLTGRQMPPLHLLCVAAGIQLVFSPALLMSASFQLSYAAMLGLLLIRPRLMALHTFKSVAGQWLWSAFTATAGAQLGILLPQLYWFGDLPLLSLLFNMAIMVYATPLMTLYWLTLAALPIPGLRDVLGTLAGFATSLMLKAVRALAQIEHAALWTRQADLLTGIGWVMLIISISVLVKRRYPRWRRALPAVLGTLLMLALLIPLPCDETTYIQFDVGNADAAVLQDHDRVIVIDTGEDGREVADYLHKRRLSVDALVLTHLHIDHAGGVQSLLDQRIPVAVCYLPYGAEAVATDDGMTALVEQLAALGTEIIHISRGDVIPLPSGTLTAAWPTSDLLLPGEDANHASLVLYGDIADVTMLLTGDLTGWFEHYAQMPADILKVAHHGSASGTNQTFLDAVDPDVMLLSNSTASRYERIAGMKGDAALYHTADTGSIIVHFEGDGHYSIETWLP